VGTLARRDEADSMSVPAQSECARRLLEITHRSEPGALVELRYRKPRAGMAQEFHPAGEVPGAVRRANGLAISHDVYFGVLPRFERSGGADAVRHSHVLWVDVDTEDAVEALTAFRPCPAIVVRTSERGLHCYWPLAERLAAMHVARANRRLAHHLGADMRSTDAARILRLPGTANHKSDPARAVVCEHFSPDEVFTARELVGALPDPQRELRTAQPSTTTRRGDDPLLTLPATVYVPALTGRPVGRDGKVTCPFHAYGQERTPSLHAYDDVARGWFCWGCDAGGSIYDFAARLWSVEPRGRDFHELRRRLAAELLPHVARVAA
jgi:hypothetical protein